MKLHDLRSPEGSRKPRKRIGRGISAGQGKTSGKGQKGQFARTAHLPVGFEGGQMRLAQRLPKLRGFHNPFRKHYCAVNLGKLNRFGEGAVVDPGVLGEAGLLSHRDDKVKVLSAGHLTVKLTLRVHRISEAARRAVEAAGGTVELLEQPSTAEPTKRQLAKRGGRAAANGGTAQPGRRAKQARGATASPAPTGGDHDGGDGEPSTT